MKNKVKLFSIFSILFLCLFCLSGCQVDDKDKTVFEYSTSNQTTFEYITETNTTKVLFNATITNNSIYDLNGYSLIIKLYNNSNLVRSETYDFDLEIKKGESHTGYFDFYADGQINSMEHIAFICIFQV